MKKIFITLCFIIVAHVSFSQAKKPTIMVMPSDVWCNQNGFVGKFDNQGYEETFSDYDKALLNSVDLNLVISKIGEMMTERGFPLKDLAATMKSIKQQSVEQSLTASRSGDMVAESALEKISKVAKADIIMQITWIVNTRGPQRSVTFNLQGIDAYTNKQVAAASGTGRSTTSSEVQVLLEDAVLSYIDQFNTQLQSHFDDLFTNGREVSILCNRWSGAEYDFESDVQGEELGIIIEDWIADNTVEGRFSTVDYSQNVLSFEQVRIPLLNESGRAIDTRRWASGLTKMLKTKYQIDASLVTRGLGKAVIVIGEK